MRHYYCFIEDGTRINAGTKVFKVSIGENRRDQVKKCLLDCYAADTGAFFRVWDDTTDFHLSQVAAYRPADSHTQHLGLNVVRTDIQTLYRNILVGSLQSMENPSHVIRNAFRLRSLLSPSFFMKNHSSRRRFSVPAVKRQNLSVRPTREDSIVAIGFALMVLLYWLGSLVGCIERSVL